MWLLLHGSSFWVCLKQRSPETDASSVILPICIQNVRGMLTIQMTEGSCIRIWEYTKAYYNSHYSYYAAVKQSLYIRPKACMASAASFAAQRARSTWP